MRRTTSPPIRQSKVFSPLISFSKPAMHQSLGPHRRKILTKSNEWILPPYILHLAHTHASGFTCTTCPCLLCDCFSGKLLSLPFELIHGWRASSLQFYILGVPSHSNLDRPQHYHTLPEKNHSLYQPLVFPSWFILCVVKNLASRNPLRNFLGHQFSESFVQVIL